MIRAGDRFPQGITIPDQDGENVHLDELIGRPLVLFFYPADGTPGCTREACSFRDHDAEFQDLGAQVIGVSGDSPASHRGFRQRHDLGFPLLSDAGGVLRRRLGIPRLLGIIDGRVTVVVDAGGRVAKVFRSQVQATRHVREALEAVQAMAAQAKA